jgi:hypothetical protein
MPPLNVSKARDVEAHASSVAIRRRRRVMKALAVAIGVAGLVATLLTSCSGSSDNALFESDFNATATGGPPAQNQRVGTVATYGQTPVVVVSPPFVTDGHWVRIARSLNEVGFGSGTGMICHLSQTVGPGKYNFLASIIVPGDSNNANPASISFVSSNDLQDPDVNENNGVYSGFLHLDLWHDRTANQDIVRINDSVNTSVIFPRDKRFDLTVNLDTTQAAQPSHPVVSVNISTIGTGTSGPTTQTYTLPPASNGQRVPTDPSQFAAVVLWMGPNTVGNFLVGSAGVTKNP